MSTPSISSVIAPRHAASAAAFSLASLVGVLFLVGCSSDPASPNNTPPVLVSLTASPPGVRVGEVCTITAEAKDPDGDNLTFEWYAGLGHLTGSGSKVYYTASSCCIGGNAVELILRDGRGGEVRDFVLVDVVPNGL